MKHAIDAGRRLAVALALMPALNGCASLGKGTPDVHTEAGAGQALAVGTSTKPDVLRLLGKANVNTFDSGHEVWVYDDKSLLLTLAGFLPGIGSFASLAEAAMPERELAILFDKDGVVRKYRLRVAGSPVARLAAPR